MSKDRISKKELRKKLEKELHIDLRDLLLIWSATLVAIFTTYWFELGIGQYRTGFNLPEVYHLALDPLVFLGVFLLGSLMYTVFAIGLLRYVLIRFLVFFGIDRF